MSSTTTGLFLICAFGFAACGTIAILESPGTKWFDSPAGFWRSLSPVGRAFYATALGFWAAAIMVLILAFV